MNRILKILLALSLVSALTGCGNLLEKELPLGKVTGLAPGATPLKIGGLAPDFNFQLMNSNSSLSGFQGKAILLNFWKSDSPLAAMEMGYLQQIYNEWSERGLEVLAVNLGDNEQAVRDFIKKNDLSFPVIMDTQLATGLKYNAESTPASFLIDQAGVTKSMKIGAYADKGEIEKDLSKISLTAEGLIPPVPVNRAPEMEPVFDRQVSEGSGIGFTVTASDPDGDNLTLAAIDLPTGATFDTTTGEFSWNTVKPGTYPVTFESTDGNLNARQVVNVMVIHVNHPPVLELLIGEQTYEEFVPVEMKVAATDPDKDNLIYSVAGLPAKATFDPRTGAFSWQAGPVGTYDIEFTVNDGNLSACQAVCITVIPAPVEDAGGGGDSGCGG